MVGYGFISRSVSTYNTMREESVVPYYKELNTMREEPIISYHQAMIKPRFKTEHTTIKKTPKGTMYVQDKIRTKKKNKKHNRNHIHTKATLFAAANMSLQIQRNLKTKGKKER